MGKKERRARVGGAPNQNKREASRRFRDRYRPGHKEHTNTTHEDENDGATHRNARASRARVVPSSARAVRWATGSAPRKLRGSAEPDLEPYEPALAGPRAARPEAEAPPRQAEGVSSEEEDARHPREEPAGQTGPC